MNIRKTIYVFLIIFFSVSSIPYAAGEIKFGIVGTVFKMIFYTIVFILVIALTSYGTRLIARNSKSFINGKYIEIIDRVNLKSNMRLEIVKINNNVYILALTNENVELIDTVSVDEFEFKEVLKSENNSNDFLYKNENLVKLKKKLDLMFSKSDKSIDKEDKDNEKDC